MAESSGVVLCGFTACARLFNDIKRGSSGSEVRLKVFQRATDFDFHLLSEFKSLYASLT